MQRNRRKQQNGKDRDLFKKIRDTKGTHRSQQTPSFNSTRDNSIHGHHQMVNAEISLIIFFAAEDEKLYTVSRKKD